ncbi:type II toxin-antitoxin system RelE family toxin [Spirosoma areae]
MYELLFTEKATKSLKKLPKADARRILVKLDQLAANPDEATNVKKLTNYPIAGFRLRVGHYRILFDKEDALKIIEVINVGNRKDIYQ